MKDGARYVVETHWGVFSLDEGAYQDYLEGKLWISWKPGKQGKTVPRPGYTEAPVSVSERAMTLAEEAEREGVCAVVRRLHVPGEHIPFFSRLGDVSIDEMNLSVRSSNGLKRAGADTFGKIRALMLREGGIRSVRNLGEKCEEEIGRLFLESCYERLHSHEKARFWQKILDSE